MTATLSLMAARELSRRVLQAAGVAAANVEPVMRALVAAEADGLAAYGLSQLPGYADQLTSGRIDGKATPVLAEAATGALTVDAQRGFAAPAIAAGLARAVDMVKTSGTVAVAIRHAHPVGAAGHYVEPLAERGLVALAVGAGAHPIAFACPYAGRAPLVIDVSFGAPSTPKDAAPALMVKLLAAALSASLVGDEEGPCFLVLDPARFSGAAFARRAGNLVDAIAAEGGSGLTGDQRLAARERARKQGISIPVDLHADLVRRAGGG